MTDVSAPPEGFAEAPLQELLDKIIDYRGQSVPKAETGIKLITARNVRFGHLSFDEQEYIAEEKYDGWMKRGIPQEGDILFITEAPLGNVAMFPTDDKYAVGQRTVTLRVDSQKLDPLYLKNFLLSEMGQLRIDLRSSGSTAKGIKSSELRKVVIDYPPLEEQRKIADILGTWDEAIEQQTRLLELKRKRKHGLMQQLLTGKVRFKEFEGLEWTTYTMGELFSKSFSGEWGAEPNANKEGLPIIRAANFTKDGRLNLDESKLVFRDIPENKLSRVLLEPQNLVLEKSGGSPDQPVGRVVIFEGPARTYGFANFLQRLVVKKAFWPKAIYYFLHHYYVTGKVLLYQQKTTGIINFQLADFLKTATLRVPHFEEQQKIAAVLSAADAELETLEIQLSSLHTQKRGLMQQLLTGKTRVNLA